MNNRESSRFIYFSMKRNSKVLNQIFNSGVEPVKPVNPIRPIPTKYPPRREDEQPVRRHSDEKPSKSFQELLEEEIRKSKANSSRRTNMKGKSIKSSKLPKEVYYMVVQGAKMYYSTDYDKVADMVKKINSEPGPRVQGPYTEDDPEEIQELFDVGYIGNSRKPVKSSVSGDINEEDVVRDLYPTLDTYTVDKIVEWVFGLDEDFESEQDLSDYIKTHINDFISEETDDDVIEDLRNGGYIDSSRQPVKSNLFYISYYGTSGDGYVGYDNEPTNDFDQAMTFNSREEAEDKKYKLQKEWGSNLQVEEFIDSSRQPIKSGTSNFVSNDGPFPIVVYIAENYIHDDETGEETDEPDYDANDWEYDDAYTEAENLADEMDITLCRGSYRRGLEGSGDYATPYNVGITSGYYEGIQIQIDDNDSFDPEYHARDNYEHEHDDYFDELPQEEQDRMISETETKLIEEQESKINAYLDKLCSDYGWIKLRVTGNFSNGETIYHKIDNSKKPVNSALNLEDTAQANVANNFNSKIFDYTWFDATDSDTTNYDLFIEDFTQWLIENGVNVNEYPNMDFDVGYYFKEFMNDIDANTTNAEAMYQQVYDWLEGEEEFMTSDQYLDDMYGNTSFTDIEFFTQDIEENARKQFRYGDNHGFKSVQDLITAVNESLDYLECYDDYDAGGMGYHAYDENNEWFETGCLFLGNGEEEWQLDPEVPFDEEYDFCDAYRDFCINRGCYMYAVSDKLYAYGVRWSDIEKKGDELGLRSAM